MVWNPVDLGSRWAIGGHDYSASLYIPFAISYHRGVHDIIYIQFKFNCKVKSGSGHTRLVARRRPAPTNRCQCGEVEKVRLLERDVKSNKIFDDDAVQVVKLVLECSRFECP